MTGKIMRTKIRVSALALVLLTSCSGSRRAPVPPLPATVAASSASVAPPTAPPNPPASLKSSLPKIDWPPEKQALHVLNRLAYGPRPSEAEAVAASGVAGWISEPLQPASIDDHDVAATP